jgi:hypothetical protein
MSYRVLQCIFSGVLFICGAGLFIHTFDSRYAAMGGEVSSLFYSRFLFLIWSVCAAIMIFQALRTEPTEVKPYAWGQTFLAAACVGLFLMLLFKIGFIISSIIFFVLLSLLAGERAYVRLGIVAVVFSISIYYIFNNFLHIRLPAFWGG